MPLSRLLLLLSIILVVIAISLTHTFDTCDPMSIVVRLYHRWRTNLYAHGFVSDRHSRTNISAEAIAFEDLLQLFPFRASSSDAETLAQLRANTDGFSYILPNPPHCIRERKIVDGNITIQWHILGDGIDNTTDAPTIIYMHGGAYIAGSLSSHSGLMCYLSRLMSVRVLGFQYRLAPEYPMPAAIIDAYRTYTWLLDEIKVKPEKVVLMGESAGGGGILLLAQHLINIGQSSRLPAGIVAYSPWTDLSMSGPSWSSNLPVDDMLGSSGLLAWARIQSVGGHLIPQTQHMDQKHPSISPLYGIYKGLPPIYINVGGDELLLDDARVFAQYAHDAGVDIHHTIAPHMEHGYAVIGADLMPEARDEMQNVMKWTRKRLGLKI